MTNINPGIGSGSTPQIDTSLGQVDFSQTEKIIITGADGNVITDTLATIEQLITQTLPQSPTLAAYVSDSSLPLLDKDLNPPGGGEASELSQADTSQIAEFPPVTTQEDNSDSSGNSSGGGSQNNNNPEEARILSTGFTGSQEIQEAGVYTVVFKPANWPEGASWPPLSLSVDAKGKLPETAPKDWPEGVAWPPQVIHSNVSLKKISHASSLAEAQSSLVSSSLSPDDVGLSALFGMNPAAIEARGQVSTHLKTINDVIEIAKGYLAKIPDGPDKKAFESYLKAVSDAMITFQNYLYVLESIDSKQSKEASKASLEIALENIEKQHKAMEKQIKAERKKAKKAKLGILGKIFNFIKIAFMAVAAAIVNIVPVFGQVASAVLLLSMAETAGKTFGASGFLGKLLEKMPKEVRVAIAACVCAAMVLCPVAFALGGGEAIKSTLIESGLITNEKLKMYLGMGIDFAMMIGQLILAVVMCLIPGGQAALLGAVNSALRIFKTSIQTTEAALKVLEAVAGATMFIATTVTLSNQIATNVLTANLKRILGNLEKDIAENEAVIKLIKALIQKLQESMQNAGKMISEINTSLASMWQSISQSTDAMHASILA